MTEEAFTFGREKGLVGVLTRPGEAAASGDRPGIVILNAGLVHRVGPNRIGVKAARRFAELGYSTLRFDLSGLGDSAPRSDGLPFHQSALAETVEAMDELGARAGVQRFVLTGICTGASASFETALVDARVAGAALINVRTLDLSRKDVVSRRALHTAEGQRVLGPRLPLDLATRAVGVRKSMRVALDLLLDLGGRAELAVETARLRGRMHLLADRGVPLFFVCSPWDSALYYRRMLLGGDTPGAEWNGRIAAETVPEADHTFSTLASQARLLQVIGDWLTQRRW